MHRARNRRLLPVVALLAPALLAGGYAVWSLWGSESSQRATFALTAILTQQALAALTALRAARAMDGSPASRVWRVLATAWLLWSLGSSLNWGAWVLKGELQGIPSVVDLLHLAGSFSLAWALATYPVNPPERFGRLRELLDVLVLTLAVLTLTWLSLLRPVLSVLGAQSILILWAGLRPAMAAVALVLAIRAILLVGPRREARALLFLGGSGALTLAASLAWAFWTVSDGYLPGMAVDVLPMGAALLATWAALSASQPDRGSAGETGSYGRRRVEALLPIAFTYAVVGFTILDASLTGDIDRGGLTVSIALSVLLVARQGVVAGQNEMRQYASLLNASGDLAFICDSEGRLRLFNPAFVAALGLVGAQPRRPLLGDFIPPDTPLAAILSKARTEGWTGETLLQRQDGTSFPAVLTLRPVGGIPGPDSLIAGTGVDLTHIKAREVELRTALHEVAAARADLQSLNSELERKVEARTEQLAKMVDDLDRLNQELRDLDKLKTEFVALVSHELRAPLTNIRSGLELLLAGNPSFDETVRDSLGLVEEEAARLGRFVEAILDLSALEAGKFLLHPSPVSPWRAAQVAVDRFRGHPARDQMRLTMPADVPDALADERALGSVFFHLLDNAVKYGGPGPILIGSRSEGDRVEVQIEDSGPGIPEAERERVFEMFHRLDSRDDREVYGHGLGLHLVRRMLRAMGGDILARVGRNGGTQMVFWLPRADAARSPEVPAAESSSASGWAVGSV